ncbi:MAG: BamA/TamA family outer membrane protein, partial [Acidobacteriota bacterium]
MPRDRCFSFEPAIWPEAQVAGIPVKLGTTRILEGRIQAVIPFTVATDCPAGDHRISVKVTYTPGLNAGHLSPHVREPYETLLTIVPAGTPPSGGASPGATEAIPEVRSAKGLQVIKPALDLPKALRPFLRPVSEDSTTARLFHRLWLDPENHGKSILAAIYPFASGSKNEGFSWGAGLAFINNTREGIGTAAINFRLFNNEYNGATAAIDVVSCPAAFHNYQLSLYQAEEGNRGVQLHVEDLTLAGGRFGYEGQFDAFEDGRFRFFGVGGQTDGNDESAYTRQELGGSFDLFWNFATNWRLSAGARVRDINLKDPIGKLGRDQPSTLDRFTNVDGLNGGAVVAERVSLIFDRRNQEFTPSQGSFGRLRVEFNQNLEDRGEDLADSWTRFELLFRQYLSSPGQRATLFFSNQWVFNTAGEDELPFWELATLGGADTLRSFDTGRFYGQHSVFATIELRLQALHMVMLGMPIDIELAPFVDTGQVFSDDG